MVANHDPHNQGRVRVRYWWQEANESAWVRLLTAHAGAGRGLLFYPELGDEVLVTFEEGDAERPYVVGSAWNGVHQPPAAGFHQPGETNGSEFAQNNIKRIVTKSGHRITLVDTPGKGKPGSAAGLQGQFSSALSSYMETAKPPSDPSLWTDAQRSELIETFKQNTGSAEINAQGLPTNDRSRRWQTIDRIGGACLLTHAGSLP